MFKEWNTKPNTRINRMYAVYPPFLDHPVKSSHEDRTKTTRELVQEFDI